jgi:transposase-like protein
MARRRNLREDPRKVGIFVRAVDRDGKTVDFRLSTRRDVAAAKAFFRKAIRSQGSTPRTITMDGYAASHRAVREMKTAGKLAADTKLRSSKYLNNLIEQDHRGVKLRIGPMLGFKWFTTAAATIAAGEPGVSAGDGSRCRGGGYGNAAGE